MRELAAEGNRTGILFGAERSGLSNEHIALADAILMAPVNPTFASLNHSQAELQGLFEHLESELDRSSFSRPPKILKLFDIGGAMGILRASNGAFGPDLFGMKPPRHRVLKPRGVEKRH